MGKVSEAAINRISVRYEGLTAAVSATFRLQERSALYGETVLVVVDGLVCGARARATLRDSGGAKSTGTHGRCARAVGRGPDAGRRIDLKEMRMRDNGLFVAWVSRDGKRSR